MDDADNFVFEDVENYRNSNKDSTNIKSIVLKQFNKCLDEFSKEMTFGGVKEVLVDNKIHQIVSPNQPEICINSLWILKNTLTQQITDNKDIVGKYFNDFSEKNEKLEIEYNQSLKKVIMPKDYAKNPPYYDNWYNNTINNIKREYEKKLVELYRDTIFIGISILLKKLNYMEEVGVTI